MQRLIVVALAALLAIQVGSIIFVSICEALSQ